MRNEKANPSADVAFVKSQQAKVEPMAGKNPRVSPEMFRYDAYMTNTGGRAQEFARKLTAGLDKKAFPVK